MKDIESTIIDFFKESPHPEDQEIHALAEELGIDKHEFEEIIYKLFGDTVSKNSKNAMEIPQDEMEKGIEVEKEHKRTITDLYNELENRDPTDDEIEEMAESILVDHEIETKDITGKPEYYTKYLIPMEEEMKKNKKESAMDTKFKGEKLPPPHYYRHPKTLRSLRENEGLKRDMEFGELGEMLENESVPSLDLKLGPEIGSSREELPTSYDDLPVDKSKYPKKWRNREELEKPYMLGKPKYKDIDRESIRNMDKESVMKINSNTFSINRESKEFQSIEDIIKRIASENKIENVEEVQIKLSKDEGMVKFSADQIGMGGIPGAIMNNPAVQQGAQQVSNAIQQGGQAVQQGAEQVGVANNPTETIQNAVLALAQRGTSLEEIQGYLSSIMTNVQQYVASQQQQQPAQQAQAPTQQQAAGA